MGQRRIQICSKYTDYTIVFLSDLAKGSPKNTIVNKYAIKQIKDKHLSYRHIYA